jgi:hypothetical protein
MRRLSLCFLLAQVIAACQPRNARQAGADSATARPDSAVPSGDTAAGAAVAPTAAAPAAPAAPAARPESAQLLVPTCSWT